MDFCWQRLKNSEVDTRGDPDYDRKAIVQLHQNVDLKPRWSHGPEPCGIYIPHDVILFLGESKLLYVLEEPLKKAKFELANDTYTLEVSKELIEFLEKVSCFYIDVCLEI